MTPLMPLVPTFLALASAQHPRDWEVRFVAPRGECQLCAIFVGPNAREMATRYAQGRRQEFALRG